jgi:hypothetical protein
MKPYGGKGGWLKKCVAVFFPKTLRKSFMVESGSERMGTIVIP